MKKENMEEMKEKVEKETRKQDKIEIVKNAINLGLDDESISKLIGLSIEEVAKMRVKKGLITK
ncbi:hypothetical protein psyc5s11_19350 [Clostridium gelidum]|uniref:Uncharacterized protein n=1 Tax=Clostridium gelidum TaxID=704125 RepID=A0ABM7T1U0_9CLOT|nr:hypothetical protein [Clostridium gelidum]BCZ45868.1 hypothetical protein psyc5s11_19350 [Clostridium gelidum]